MKAICNHDACRVYLVNGGDLQVHILIGRCRIEIITYNDTSGTRRVVESEMFAKRGMGFICECM